MSTRRRAVFTIGQTRGGPYMHDAWLRRHEWLTVHATRGPQAVCWRSAAHEWSTRFEDGSGTGAVTG